MTSDCNPARADGRTPDRPLTTSIPLATIRIAPLALVPYPLDTELPFLRRIQVRVGTRDIVIATCDVQYIAAHGVYARLYTPGGVYLLREAMHWIERRLDPASFVRIHRSYIVNAEYARELRTQPDGDRVVVLVGGARRSRSAGAGGPRPSGC